MVGNGLAAVDDRRGLVAHRLQRISAIALMAHRQQVAIFGIEQEQQAIEQAQAGVSNFGPPRLVMRARVGAARPIADTSRG